VLIGFMLLSVSKTQYQTSTEPRKAEYGGGQ